MPESPRRAPCEWREGGLHSHRTHPVRRAAVGGMSGQSRGACGCLRPVPAPTTDRQASWRCPGGSLFICPGPCLRSGVPTSSTSTDPMWGPEPWGWAGPSGNHQEMGKGCSLFFGTFPEHSCSCLDTCRIRSNNYPLPRPVHCPPPSIALPPPLPSLSLAPPSPQPLPSPLLSNALPPSLPSTPPPVYRPPPSCPPPHQCSCCSWSLL